MSSNSVDIKLISCNNLKSFNFFQKPSVYAVACIGTGDRRGKAERSQVQKTPTDRYGGRNPEWNHEMSFDLDQIPSTQRNLLFLEFDLLCDRILGDRLLGQVRVPLSDLIEGADLSIRFVRYQVRTSDGKSNGILNFSYKVNIKGKIACYPTVDSSPAVIFPFPAIEFLPQSPGPQLPGLPTDPYSFRTGGCGYASCGYPTVDQFQPYDGDTWRKRLDP